MARKSKNNPPMLKVGQVVWVFDVNRRVYTPLTAAEKKAGGLWSKGPPIWREHWRKGFIDRETRVAWYANAGMRTVKLAKKTVREEGLGAFTDVIFSKEQLDQRVWVEENLYLIKGALANVGEYAIWKAVADLIGYKEK